MGSATVIASGAVQGPVWYSPRDLRGRRIFTLQPHNFSGISARDMDVWRGNRHVLRAFLISRRRRVRSCPRPQRFRQDDAPAGHCRSADAGAGYVEWGGQATASAATVVRHAQLPRPQRRAEARIDGARESRIRRRAATAHARCGDIDAALGAVGLAHRAISRRDPCPPASGAGSRLRASCWPPPRSGSSTSHSRISTAPAPRWLRNDRPSSGCGRRSIDRRTSAADDTAPRAAPRGSHLMKRTGILGAARLRTGATWCWPSGTGTRSRSRSSSL